MPGVLGESGWAYRAAGASPIYANPGRAFWRGGIQPTTTCTSRGRASRGCLVGLGRRAEHLSVLGIVPGAPGGRKRNFRVVSPPLEHTSSTRSRAAAPVCGALVPSERPWATRGPVPVAYRLHGRWSVVLVARRPQQARAAVPWVAGQLRPHAQPVQARARLWRRAIACGDGPARPHRTAPPRPEDASRSAPIAGGEIELALLRCAAA